MALDPSTLARSGHSLGDEIKITTPHDGVRTYRIVGTATYGTGATGGATYLFFTMHDIREIALQGQEGYTGLWIVTNKGANVDQISTRTQELLPTGYTSQTGAQMAEDLREQLDVGLGFVNVFLLAFAGIALVVASLLILNTFSILVTQRSRELALLRALGATRPQVLRSVLAEAAVVGMLGSTLGLGVGYGLVWAILAIMRAFGIDLGTASPPLTMPVVLASYAVGILLTTGAAWLPARRASATRPVEAMTIAGDASSSHRPPMVGIAMLEFGVAAIVCAVWLPVPQKLIWLAAGAVLLLVGTVMATTLLGWPLVSALRALFGRVFGDVGRMAGLNAVRQPARTAATAATLMIGLALVTTVAILADSTTASVKDRLTVDQRGDFTINPITGQPFDAKVVDEAAKVDGVDAAYGFYSGLTTVDNETVGLSGMSSDALTRATALDVTGSLTAEGNMAPAVISSDLAKDQDLGLGHLLDLASPSGQQVKVLITGVYPSTDTGSYGDVIVTPETYAKLADAKVVRQVIVLADKEADLASVRSGLDGIVKQRPTLLVTDVDEYVQARVDRFTQLFGILYGLLGLAVVIAILGIINTLSLSVAERTREVGLLRAVGMTRPQLRRMVRLEAVIVSIMGALLGIVIGLVCGSALVHLLADQGVDQLRVPWLLLGAFVLVAGVLGVLAAVGPARRAAKLNVLDAIASP